MKAPKLLLALLMIWQLVAPLRLAAEEINLNLLVQETQKRAEGPGELNFVWWIPEEYWRASLAQNPNNTPAQTETIVSVFRPYLMIAIVEGKTDTVGTVTYKSEAEIRAKLRLVDNQGNTYTPLAEDGVNISTRSFLAMMKPVLANILGPMGQNMYFFVFVAKDNNGLEIANPKKYGSFTVKLGDKDFKWTLPLSSLVTEKICPACKQKLNGTYKYCPWDGSPLP